MADPLGLIGNDGAAPLLPQSSKIGGQKNTGFKDVLMQHIEQVNKLQQDAEMAVEDLSSGRRDDVAGVLIAKQKADLAFQMLLHRPIGAPIGSSRRFCARRWIVATHFALARGLTARARCARIPFTNRNLWVWRLAARAEPVECRITDFGFFLSKGVLGHPFKNYRNLFRVDQLRRRRRCRHDRPQ